MIKHINGWNLSKKLKVCKVYVKNFSVAKVRCLKDHVKLSLSENPELFILHVGTNNLDSDRSPELIAKSIVDTFCS